MVTRMAGFGERWRPAPRCPGGLLLADSLGGAWARSSGSDSRKSPPPAGACDERPVAPQQSAQTLLRGTEEKCGSPLASSLSGARPPLRLRLSENSGDESVSDAAWDSLSSSPCSATPHSQKPEPPRE